VISISEMQPGEELDVSSMVMKVFNQFVAYEYNDEGRKTFLSFVEPKRIKSDFDKGNIVLVAKYSGKIVGIIEIRNDSHIALLFVSSEYHKQGIAKALRAKVMDLCITRVSDLEEFTVNSSTFAIPIYKKMGFSICGEKQTKDGIVFTPMKLKIRMSS